MNKNYTFYSPDTGIVTTIVNCSEEVLANILLTFADNYIEGEYLKELYYFQNDIPIRIPDAPDKNSVFNYITKEWEVDLVLASRKVLNIRQQLLQESDWTDTVSAQTRLGIELYNSWQIYRQALRDITIQEGFPLAVNWPQAPV